MPVGEARAMRVLVLAPHPYYQERGTPIAVDLLVRALGERGDTVDVLTFHEGEDRTHPGVTIHRIRPPVFGRVRQVRPGPSFKKLVCDAYMFGRMVRLLRRQRYDLIHAVEESSFMAMALAPLFSVPFVCDIDSSMTTQIVDRYRLLGLVKKPLKWLESLPARQAIAVLPVCEALADELSRYPIRHMTVLADVSLMDEKPDMAGVESIRETLGVDGPIAMYIGNLEPYQGIDLLLEAFATVSDEIPDAHIVIIGGEPDDIGYYRKRSHALGTGARVHLIGKRPVEQIGAYMAQADVLVSPRLQGVNTPMKVYTYLHSGVAVLATDLYTHTQVMNSEIASLAPPDPESFGAALRDLLRNPGLRAGLAGRALKLIEEKHSYRAFRNNLYGVYEHLDRELGLHGPASPHRGSPPTS